jgi:RNA-binding protein YhbY
VGDNGLDKALLLEVGKALASERAVDLHSVDQSSDGDQTVRLDILVELLGGGLVEKDGVLGLVLDLALRPLLLLLLCSSSGRL